MLTLILRDVRCKTDDGRSKWVRGCQLLNLLSYERLGKHPLPNNDFFYSVSRHYFKAEPTCPLWPATYIFEFLSNIISKNDWDLIILSFYKQDCPFLFSPRFDYHNDIGLFRVF